MQKAFFEAERVCGGRKAAIERACAPMLTKVQEATDKLADQASSWWSRLPLALAPSAATNAAASPGRRRGSRDDGGAPTAARALDLGSLNPSLYVIGLDVVERMAPRYIQKAGIACERMQHAQLPVDVIRNVLSAIFICPEDAAEQSEEALRQCFALFDASGDGALDQDEFLAVLPLLGEDVPETVVDKLFDAIDRDTGGTIDGAEFVHFMRAANPFADGAPSGWRAFLPEAAAHFEEMVLLHVGTRNGAAARARRDGRAWEVVQPSELELVQRQADAPYSMSLLLPRADLANCEALIASLRKLGWKDEEVRTVAKALFVTNSDEDYAKVFQIFDRDNTGGIDPFEFRAIMAVLGDHSTEGEARQLFLDADVDNDGMLDVTEFCKLLAQVSPKASTASEAQIQKEAMARERLQARIGASDMARVDPASVDAMVQVLVLGAPRSGKTFLLNQVLADKLPKGRSVAVGVSALSVRIGHQEIAVQVLDTPGDARFQPLAKIFYPTVRYAILLFDATSFKSFEAVTPLFEAYVAANPNLDVAAHVCLVSNVARLGVKRAVSSGFALEWCQQHGGMAFFEVDPEVPQGILEPLHHLADEYLTANPLTRSVFSMATSSAQDDAGDAAGSLGLGTRMPAPSAAPERSVSGKDSSVRSTAGPSCSSVLEASAAAVAAPSNGRHVHF